MIVYIINNGMGGEIHSVWLDKKSAFTECGRLNNQQKGFGLGWQVTESAVK